MNLIYSIYTYIRFLIIKNKSILYIYLESHFCINYALNKIMKKFLIIKIYDIYYTFSLFIKYLSIFSNSILILV